MDAEAIRRLLDEVRAGAVTVAQALERLKDLPYQELGFATLDHHRGLRQGFPEVLFCEGKTADQVEQIARAALARNACLLATRATAEAYEALRRVEPAAQYNALARTVVARRAAPPPPVGRVLIVTAGTADLPVAEEAVVTAGVLGSACETLYDVGAAGIHRVLDKRDRLAAARVIVVVAGMDGVLASVVGGLTDRPVIAVPTSVGYGASFGGIAPLLTMLNSCAAGVAVMNIDNGFGAAVLAHRINTLPSPD
ncbi:MAG TPA: nickel pincer cofactor biosynthesis protein LarB [Candidatus Sulfotelmatobacter sp.]|nr:nickel pincer cofactor biosynthesis protein LarB [Candidatus Sulfotelmatobacter sp.]